MPENKCAVSRPVVVRLRTNLEDDHARKVDIVKDLKVHAQKDAHNIVSAGSADNKTTGNGIIPRNCRVRRVGQAWARGVQLWIEFFEVLERSRFSVKLQEITSADILFPRSIKQLRAHVRNKCSRMRAERVKTDVLTPRSQRCFFPEPPVGVTNNRQLSMRESRDPTVSFVVDNQCQVDCGVWWQSQEGTCSPPIAIKPCPIPWEAKDTNSAGITNKKRTMSAVGGIERPRKAAHKAFLDHLRRRAPGVPILR